MRKSFPSAFDSTMHWAISIFLMSFAHLCFQHSPNMHRGIFIIMMPITSLSWSLICSPRAHQNSHNMHWGISFFWCHLQVSGHPCKISIPRCHLHTDDFSILPSCHEGFSQHFDVIRKSHCKMSFPQYMYNLHTGDIMNSTLSTICHLLLTLLCGYHLVQPEYMYMISKNNSVWLASFKAEASDYGFTVNNGLRCACFWKTKEALHQVYAISTSYCALFCFCFWKTKSTEMSWLLAPSWFST